jgi:hypothetical protein
MLDDLDIDGEEFNDDPDRVHPVYREIAPDYDKSHRKGLLALERLKKKYS